MPTTRISETLTAQALREGLTQGAGATALTSEADVNRAKKAFMAAAREVCPGFAITEAMKPTVNDIFRWCCLLPGRLDPQRGLMLHGDIGTGKTTMLEIARIFAQRMRPRDDKGRLYGFRTASAIGVASDFNSEGYGGIRTYCESDRQAFDDLGLEPTSVNYYGTRVNPMQHVLLARYDRFTATGDFTHITTNLNLQGIRDLYGDQVYDRCKQMFNMVEMNGSTWRRANG